MDEVNQPAHYTSGGIKTDRELLQQSLNVLRHLCLHSRAVIGYDGEQVQAGIDALKARLAQPEREWVGLTDEETNEIARKWQETPDGLGDLCRAIEAKLKEKNK